MQHFSELKRGGYSSLVELALAPCLLLEFILSDNIDKNEFKRGDFSWRNM